MARAEQLVTDRETMREIVAFMGEAVREGLTEGEIASQIDLMLDKTARKRLARAEKDVREGRVKRFKTARDLLVDLHAADPSG